MSDTDPPPDPEHPLLVLARRGFDDVHSDPQRADEALRVVIEDPTAPPQARMIARWGAGRIDHDAGRVLDALAQYGEAIELAHRHGFTDDELKITMSLSSALVLSGDHVAALSSLDAVAPLVDGAVLGRLLTQRAFVLGSVGRIAEAEADAARALVLLRNGADVVGEIRLRINRGWLLLPVGRTAQVREDLETALELAQRDGQQVLVAAAAHNLGYLDFLLGRLPSALRAYALARERYAALGSTGRPNADLDVDECRLLLAAGFPDEALTIANRLIADAIEAGNVHQRADGELLAAQGNMILGNDGEAAAAARRAAALFAGAGRTPWIALAEYIGAMAAARVDPAAAIPTLEAAAATLTGLGWPGETAEVLVRLGEVALAAGDVERARTALSRAVAMRRRASVRVRAAAWHATALLRLIEDRPAAARRAIDAGLRIVDRHRASLGASELRARAAADGVELAELGLRLAMRSGRPTDVLIAAERWRAGSLATRTDVGGSMRPVEHDLAELRRLSQELRGIGDGPTSAGPDAESLRSEVLRLERRITSATRLAEGDPRAVATRLDLAELKAALGGATLAEYIDIDGELHVVVVSSGRTRLIHLASRDAVLALIDHALFSIRRLAGIPPGHPRAATVLEQHRRTVTDLNAALVAPLRLTANEVVVVPTGALHAVPWSALPGLACPGGLQIAPSAAWWIGADVASAHGTGTLLVHGPDLPHAAAEVVALAGVHAEARPTVLLDDAATAAAVLAAMEDADLVHLAAHGTFRADNPMFSSLRLADGPLSVHDFQRLVRSPRIVVLTACSAARSGVYGGDELLGTSVALLALGVRSVVAPFLPVRDDATRTFAVDLHTALALGATPQAALAAAVARATRSGDPGLVAAAASFTCIGRRERRRSGVSAAAERRLWDMRSTNALGDDQRVDA